MLRDRSMFAWSLSLLLFLVTVPVAQPAVPMASLPSPVGARLASPLGAGNSQPDVRNDGGTWLVETVDSSGEAGTYASLALDAAGRPHIAYGGPGVRYALYDGGSWSIETVDPAGSGGISLKLDAAGRPHISYLGTGLYYASYDGAAWSINLVDPAAGYAPYPTEDTSLALDHNGQPHIAYRAGPYDLRYAHPDGGGWLTETVPVGPSDWQVGYPSLALDSADRPRVGFTRTMGGPFYYVIYLYYAWNNGTSWEGQIVDPLYGGWYEEMVLDAADHPHVAYQTGAPPFIRLPAYAYEEGGTWSAAVVDESGLAGDISLALDGAGRPHVVYSGGDYGCPALRYASLEGTSWVTETVVTVTQGALIEPYFSLALDAQGYAHVAYYDLGLDALRYAHQGCNPLEAVSVTGPMSLPLGITGLYTATHTPLTATVPAFTWDSGASGAVASYGWTLTGTHSLAVTGTNSCSQATAGLTVTVFCQPLNGVTVRGPRSLLPGLEGTFWVTAQPITSSPPVTFTWDNGVMGSSASYSWTLTGTYTLTVSATNVCGGNGMGAYAVQVLVEWPYEIYLPLLQRTGMR